MPTILVSHPKLFASLSPKLKKKNSHPRWFSGSSWVVCYALQFLSLSSLLHSHFDWSSPHPVTQAVKQKLTLFTPCSQKPVSCSAATSASLGFCFVFQISFILCFFLSTASTAPLFLLGIVLDFFSHCFSHCNWVMVIKFLFQLLMPPFSSDSRFF